MQIPTEKRNGSHFAASTRTTQMGVSLKKFKSTGTVHRRGRISTSTIWTATRRKELSYNSYGVLFSRGRYDEHQNVTDVEMLGPDGSIVRKESTATRTEATGTRSKIYTLHNLKPCIPMTIPCN